MAIIEFTPSGEILTANQNFLDVVGYRLDEIQGKHHKIFMNPMDAGMKSYVEFWQRLSDGEYISNRFKRVAKGEKTIWLEASYTPVFDENNKVVKVIKFATDITQKVDDEIFARGQIIALNKVMAVIEFDLKGNIIRANKNFLDTVGYSETELKGKHHSLFVGKNLKNSSEYQAFWDKLAQGIPDSGTYRRFKKNGEELWLEASYNPIFDMDGNVTSVIKYATDVGQNPNSQLLDRVINDVTDVVHRISNGDLTAKMKNHVTEKASLYDKNIHRIEDALGQMVDRLHSTIGEVIQTTNDFRVTSQSIVSSSQVLGDEVRGSSDKLMQTFETMQAATQMIKNSVEQANHTVHTANQVKEQTATGVTVMNQTVSAMNEIQDSSQRISEIVSLIDGIAFQTNLLALNAAVEAARAGEHGRGFAVVAGEVRALAQKSAEAAKDIRVLIEETVTRVDEGSKLANRSGEMLNQISHSIDEVTTAISNISSSASEQAQQTELAYQGLTDVREVMSNNINLVSENSNSALAISDKAKELKEDVDYFQLGDRHLKLLK